MRSELPATRGNQAEWVFSSNDSCSGQRLDDSEGLFSSEIQGFVSDSGRATSLQGGSGVGNNLASCRESC